VPREAVEQAAGDARSHDGLAPMDHAHGLDEVVGGHVLEQEAGRTSPQRVDDVLVEVVRRQDQHAGRVAELVEPARRLDAVHARHPDVHEDDVGPQRPHLRQRDLAVGGLADHLDVRLGLQDEAEAGAQQRLVVDQQDADRHDGLRVVGRVVGGGAGRLVGRLQRGGREGGADDEAAPRSWLGPEGAAAGLHPLAERLQAVAGRSLLGVPSGAGLVGPVEDAAAVVLDSQPQAVRRPRPG
jgi:hypothetical protein